MGTYYDSHIIFCSNHKANEETHFRITRVYSDGKFHREKTLSKHLIRKLNMFSIDTRGSFKPVVFAIGSDDEDDSEDNHSEVVSRTKTAEEFCFTVANSGKSLGETHNMLQSYHTQLTKNRERLLAGLNEREQKLGELQNQKLKLEHIRDQIETTVSLIERRVFLLSVENLRRSKTSSKYLEYKEVLQNTIKQIKVRNQNWQTKASGLFGQLSLKLKKRTH